MQLGADDPLAAGITRAIKGGDVAGVSQLLVEHPGLAAARIIRGGDRSRPVFMQVADWPGFFPNAPEIARLLVANGADVNVAGQGNFTETALHWAASSDDRELAEVLLDLGADMEASGGSIAGGTPLDNAVGYGCWQVARLLVDRGSRANKLWVAAAMGLLDLVRERVETDPPPNTEEINHAFYQACSGAQPRTAEYLLSRGADVNFSPDYARGSTPLSAATSLETRRQTIADWLRNHGAK